MKKMKLMVSQNFPFIPIKEAWDARSRNMLPFDEEVSRKLVEQIDAKVLSNRKPPYSLTGGLFDALSDTNGEVLSATNQEAAFAGQLFEKLEGIDIDTAAAFAVATLVESVKMGKVEKDAIVMLNITGGGIKKYKEEHEYVLVDPLIVFPVNPDPKEVTEKLSNLFH
jgi:cysteate synthase